jgi:von Willebrand factor type A domain
MAFKTCHRVKHNYADCYFLARFPDPELCRYLLYHRKLPRSLTTRKEHEMTVCKILNWRAVSGVVCHIVVQDAYLTVNGERTWVPNVAIVVTDGNSNIQSSLTPVEAARCRAQNIRLVVVGVGDWINMFELSTIASQPLSANLFLLETTNRTENVTAQLIRSTCDGQ